MKELDIYFYGSTKIVTGYNSLSEESIKSRNQIISFNGIDSIQDQHLKSYAEKYYLKPDNQGLKSRPLINEDINIAIIPFSYYFSKKVIIKNIEYIFNKYKYYDIFNFSMFSFKEATRLGYRLLVEDSFLRNNLKGKEIVDFLDSYCCYAHYYISLIKESLDNLGYISSTAKATGLEMNLIYDSFYSKDNKLIINADAGL